MKWLSIVCFLGLCCFLHAGHRIEGELEEKIHALEIESGIKSPPQRTSFNLFGEFLYWKTSLDGVAWATTGEVVAVTGDGLDLNEIKTRTVHFEYSPAFQIGMGVGLPYDHWDVATRWLRTFSTGRDHAKGALTANIGNRIILDSIGLIIGLPTPPFPNKASAKCHVHLDVVDLVLGRTFLWSRYFSFRPFAGVRGAWLRLDWDFVFTMPIQPNFSPAQSFTFVDIHNHFNAGGFVGGFETVWNLYRGFGFFSYASASLVYGKSAEKTKQKLFLLPSVASAEIAQMFTAQNATHAVKAIFDIGIGLKWEQRFAKHCRLLLNGGYDFFYWPAVTQKTVDQITRVRDRSDLSFQGLMLGARMDF